MNTTITTKSKQGGNLDQQNHNPQLHRQSLRISIYIRNEPTFRGFLDLTLADSTEILDELSECGPLRRVHMDVVHGPTVAFNGRIENQQRNPKILIPNQVPREEKKKKKRKK